MTTLSEFDFDCTTPIHLQQVGAVTNARYAGRLMGNVGHRYLIVQQPSGMEVEAEEKLIVRMVLGNAVIGFETAVREVVGGEVKMLLVDYPERVESINLRRSDRLEVFIPADIRVEGGTENPDGLSLRRGMIVDISSGGCRFTAKRAIAEAADLALSFSLPGESHLYTLSGPVIESIPNSGAYAHRVRFEKETSDVLAVAEISRWIARNATFAVRTTATNPPT